MFLTDEEYNLMVQKLPILCVDLLIVKDNKCLMLKRDNSPAIGQYWFPGGRLFKFETIKEACIRIAMEETNLECEFIRIVSVEETIFLKEDKMVSDKHTVNCCCHLIPKGNLSLRIDKYHSDYKWIDKRSKSYHQAVNNPLMLIGFNAFESD